MNYWQIASGSFSREYAEEFLRYGLAFVGGQDPIATMAHVEVGDVMLLKRGTSEVIAVGRVITRNGRHRGDGDKEWLRDFDGWDLSAYCFVEWHKPDRPMRASGLTRGPIRKVHEPGLIELAERILSTVPAQQTLAPEPGPTKPVLNDQVLEFLIHQGLRPGAGEELTVTFNRICLLARYYYRYVPWEHIREHETRAFLVVPLLLALGWAEQQIKIELPVKDRKRADVACFSKPFAAESSECVLIIETKGFSQGLDYAPGQGKAYAEDFPSCLAVVVSNGYCYKAYTREAGDVFPETPSAYLNLLSPRDRYPRDPANVDGALEVLRLLLPQSWR